MKSVDLHTHSTASDGTMTPAELVDYAAQKGLSAIALTDHDTTDGIRDAVAEADRLRKNGVDIELIPGIELSTGYKGKEIHIVGLFIDPDNEYLKRRLGHFISGRTKRNKQLCDLCTKNGIPISYEELLCEYKDTVITRAHFAKLMVKKGYASSVKEAFDRFLGDGKSCYVSRKKISPQRGIEIIRRAGGFPIFAHPVLTGMSDAGLDALTGKLKKAGLMGIEAYYGTYFPRDERAIRALARKYDLCESGGSDFHGQNKPHIDIGKGTGRLFIPYEVLGNIKSRYNIMLKDNASYRLKKILFTDLDGTLLDSEKNISSYTFDILKQWTQAGHYIALCSGRDVNSVLDVYHHIGLDRLNNIYAIAYNGGQIYDCQKKITVYQNRLAASDVEYLYKEAKKAGIYLHAYSDTHIIAPGNTPELEFYTRVIKTPVIIDPELVPSIPEGTCKCLAIDLNDRSKLAAFVDNMKDYNDKHNISMMFSSDKYLEVIPKDSGKGAAVSVLCKLIEEPDLMIVAAGDEQNDISMLDEADVAIAMSNGIDEIKNHSTTVTDHDNNHDGLAEAVADII